MFFDQFPTRLEAVERQFETLQAARWGRLRRKARPAKHSPANDLKRR